MMCLMSQRRAPEAGLGQLPLLAPLSVYHIFPNSGHIVRRSDSAANLELFCDNRVVQDSEKGMLRDHNQNEISILSL
jgi:hypothetical protein